MRPPTREQKSEEYCDFPCSFTRWEPALQSRGTGSKPDRPQTPQLCPAIQSLFLAPWFQIRYHQDVGRWQELLETARRSPANVRFRDLCGLLMRLGYELDRKRGSHRIYRHPRRRDLPIVNLQEGGTGKAKPYQVREVLGIVDTYKLEVD